MSRTFIFIDESGDAGSHLDSTSSSYYQLNIVVAKREMLGKIALHFSRFRYSADAEKEIDKYLRAEKTRRIIMDIFHKTSLEEGIHYFIYRIDKKSYVGPYYQPLQSKKFRNFIIRIALEKLFSELFYGAMLPESIEVVIDRYLYSYDDQLNLQKYLRGNYNLPRIHDITQIDSEYSEHMQCADVLGKLVKKYIENGGSISNLDFVKFIDISNPGE